MFGWGERFQAAAQPSIHGTRPVAPEAGISMEKDFQVDETFLKTKTKAELGKMGVKTFGVTEATAAAENLKKTDLIKLLLGHQLAGKVPAEIAKEIKIITFGKRKSK